MLIKNREKMTKIKKYTVSSDSLVYAISFVEKPAIESEFVYFSQDEFKQVCLKSDDKHMVYGAALIPDFPIYRYNGKEEYYIEFSKESIETLAHNFLMDGRNYNFTLQHETESDDVSIIESWIKLSENDKSVDLGLNVPVGSWIIGAKVNDDEIWKQIKDGKARGFSVESLLNFEELMSKQDMNTEELINNEETVTVNEGFWTKLVNIIKEALKNPEVPQLEAEVTAVEVVDEIKEEVLEPTEEVIEEPIVEEEVIEEPIVEETPIEEPSEIAEEVAEEVIEEAETNEDAADELQKIIDELNAKIDALNDELESLKLENEKLSKQPSAKPVKTMMGSDNRTPFERLMAVMNANK